MRWNVAIDPYMVLHTKPHLGKYKYLTQTLHHNSEEVAQSGNPMVNFVRKPTHHICAHRYRVVNLLDKGLEATPKSSFPQQSWCYLTNFS